MGDKFDDIDALLNEILKPQDNNVLKDLFNKRLNELRITPTNALDILKLERRTLNGILNGTQKMVDFNNIIKISNFLQIPKEKIAQLYMEVLEKNFQTEIPISAKKIKFIKDNFDLIVLRQSGFISSITDFEQIEKKITLRLGLKSIFEYQKPNLDAAFSSGLFKQQNELTRSFWIKAAIASFEEINNPYDYDRQALIGFFPQIRWHTTNVEFGLLEIIKFLYRIGITVVYRPPLQALQLRGATFSINEKPCIVLTNYMGFYTTLWFALIHELYHVLFDWEEIKKNSYHLTDDLNEQLSVKERENEADKFAREYLFSKEKSEKIRPFLRDHSYVNEFATINHIHPSVIYVFNAFDVGNSDRMAWARARKQSPDVNVCIDHVNYPWTENKPVEIYIESRKKDIYK